MKTLREQITDGIACWCRNIPKGHPDHKEVLYLSSLVFDIVWEIKHGPIAELLREIEWIGADLYCPSCSRDFAGRTEKGESLGHSDDCKLAAILKELKE